MLYAADNRALDTISPQHADLRRLRFIEGRLSLESAILDSFDNTMLHLKSFLQNLDSRISSTTSSSPNTAHSWITSLQRHASCNRNTTQYLNDRCRSASQLLLDTLDFKNRFEVQKQSENVLTLTRYTVDDSINVRVITVITMLYLSSTVVAVSTGSRRLPR